MVLNAGNVTFMLGATNARLDELMGLSGSALEEQERVFHYLPFCFAGSWILRQLTALSRTSVLSMSQDLTKLAEELSVATPDYFLNVPTLLTTALPRARIEKRRYSKRPPGWICRTVCGAAKALGIYAGRNRREIWVLWLIGCPWLFPKWPSFRIFANASGRTLRLLFAARLPWHERLSFSSR